MRQAGRYLPEYRELKKLHSFRTLVRTPDLAVEVTLQPLHRFPNLDAAILFSDILVIPEALGVDYRFKDSGGIELERTVRSKQDISRLQPEGTVNRLDYVGKALCLLKSTLGEKKALLGFSGAPWTLALYLVEGGSPGEGKNLRRLLYEDPAAAELLKEKVTTACVDYIHMQCRSGADAVQVFDSWAGLCPADFYEEWCIEPIQRIRAACDLPLILFSRGASQRLKEQVKTRADCLAIDWSTSFTQARQTLGESIALQGNLDPLVLQTHPDLVRTTVSRFLNEASSDPGHILNCGHGVTPETKIECVEALLETVTAD